MNAPGSPFVTVADNIFGFFCLTENLCPFPAGGESSAPSSAQTGFCDFVHNLLGSHVKQGFSHGAVAAYSDIFPYGFCIDMPAVFRHTGLFL